MWQINELLIEISNTMADFFQKLPRFQPEIKAKVGLGLAVSAVLLILIAIAFGSFDALLYLSYFTIVLVLSSIGFGISAIRGISKREGSQEGNFIAIIAILSVELFA